MADTAQRSGMDWRGLLPANIAKKQSVWELDQRILRAWEAGATHTAIGRALHMTTQHVHQRKTRAQCRPVSPLELHLAALVERLRQEVISKVRKARSRADRRCRERHPPDAPARPYGRREVIVRGNMLVLGGLVAASGRPRVNVADLHNAHVGG